MEISTFLVAEPREKGTSGLSPRDVFYLYHFSVGGARSLLTIDAHRFRFRDRSHKAQRTGFLIDFTEGQLSLDTFKLDDCLALRSGETTAVRYPLCLPSCLPNKGEGGKEDASGRVKERETDILAVKYRLGGDIRTLYFRVALR